MPRYPMPAVFVFLTLVSPGAITVSAGAEDPAPVIRVVDDFETGSNPNVWAWANETDDITINPEGGNSGAWLDTGAPYLAVHPFMISQPPAGSPLQLALASGKLRSASIDLQRLDTTGVVGCSITHLQASFVSLALMDFHTAENPIEAHTTITDTSVFPEGFFPWLSAAFAIPGDGVETPRGWELFVPEELEGEYTWSDLMHNIDAIRFFVGNPDQSAFTACSHLGADNIVVTYADSIFADDFE